LSCKCRGEKRASSIESREIEELLSVIRKSPKTSSLILELVNSFRPTESTRVKSERLFTALKEMVELGHLSYSECEKVSRVLKRFFIDSSDKQRGDFLELLLTKAGPLTFKGRYRRFNQCNIFKGSEAVSGKEIDVAFVGKEVMELHECKVNMVRQWRGNLKRGRKRGDKLRFLEELPDICNGEREVVPCCTSLDGRLGIAYVKLLFKFYGFKRLKLFGRDDLIRKLVG
jgi:hypothetical protein